MFSEIGNKGLLRRLAAALKILDVKQFPSRLETDSVKVVAALDLGPNSFAQWQAYQVIGAAGLFTLSWQLFGGAGSGNFPTAANDPDKDNDVVILGMHIAVQLDAAGAAALAGQRVVIVHQRQALGATIGVLTMGIINTQAIAGPQLYYDWSFPFWSSKPVGASTPYAFGPESVYVPAGSIYSLVIATSGGGAWPANTDVTVEAFGIKVPKGFRGPYL